MNFKSEINNQPANSFFVVVYILSFILFPICCTGIIISLGIFYILNDIPIEEYYLFTGIIVAMLLSWIYDAHGAEITITKEKNNQ